MQTVKMTVPQLRTVKEQGRKLTMLTAYDYPTARLADEAGIDIILVGDSVGMVVLGYDSTLPVTMEEMLHHTRAARRGTKRGLLVGDMPFLSFGVDPAESVRNAGRFIKEAGAEAVKLEGGSRVIEHVRAIVNAQIPVMGHLGLTPQSVNALGGYKVQGRSAELAEELLAEARELEAAGCFSLVLEAVPAEVASYISQNIAIPTIGIGAGPGCDGQVLVFHDALGLHGGHYAKFVRRFADGRSVLTAALQEYIAAVQSGEFPSASESYHLSGSEADKLHLYSH